MGNLVEWNHQNSKQAVECLQEALDLIRLYEIPFHLIHSESDSKMIVSKKISDNPELFLPPFTVFTDRILFIAVDGCTQENGYQYILSENSVEFLQKNLKMPLRKIVLTHRFLNTDHSVCDERMLDAIKGIDENYKVTMVIQGGKVGCSEYSLDGVRCVTIPSMSENEENFYQIIDIE